MKKSMIATAVVATAGLAASANAGYFTISAASVSGPSATDLTTPAGTFAPGGGSVGSFNLELNGASASDAGAASYTGTAGSVYTGITNANANSIASAIGLATDGSMNGTMAYFGYEDSASGPGYFGVAFIGNGSTIDFSMGQANYALAGVHTNLIGSQFVGNTWIDSVSTVANQAYVAIFADTQLGSQLGAGSVSDTSFNVRYLDFDGTNWNTVGSANTVASSSLNYATYNVPVPAPALLAGAGLVGAAALRRRMAKKA